MSKNEQQDNAQDNVIILSSYIDTNQAHDLLFKWIEKQNSENYVRDHFFVKEMHKKYYGCIGFWFQTKALNPKEKATNIVVIVPGSNKVPEAITELSKYYDYNKFEETTKEYTPISITDDEAEPKAYELLKKQYPSLFDEFGKLDSNTEIAGACSVAIPVWEGTYNSKYGKEHKFYIDAQTGETTGDLYNDKSKAPKKPTKRLTPNEIKELGKSDIALEKITSTSKKEETTSKKDKTNEKPKEAQKEAENNDEDDDIDENESHRYIIIFLIVVAIAILLFIGSKILNPNHDPNVPNTQKTSITAQQKPKYNPPPKNNVEKNKTEREKPENFADSIIKKLVSQKYKEINELMSKNPDEFAEIEGYTNVTSAFENLGELESYYSKTTSIFPEKTTKIFSQSNSNDNSENKLPDGSAIPNVIKEQAKEDNNLISVYTSYIETYNETDSIGNSSEKKDRTILIFTLSTEDNKTKIKSIHRKYEQVDEDAISQIIEKESNSYSEISQNKEEDKKENKTEEKPKEEENKNNSETSYQQPKQEVESQTTTKKPQINLIPEGSTYVENEPTKPKQEKKNIEEVETSTTTSTTQQTNSPSNVYSSSEGSESGSAGGSVQ